MRNEMDAGTCPDVEPPIQLEDPDATQWDEETDVAVVGFGGAGACAAIAAAEDGARVVAIDRFMGGGATAMSGGVYYAGGGTPHQRAAGVEDSPEEMRKYLALETKGVVQEATLRRFCDESVEHLAWLETQNVPFEGSLCPNKTSYPTNRHRLYYSGNELSTGYREHARPAPRGHIANGKKGFRAVAGPTFFDPLRRSAAALGVALRIQSRVHRLFVDRAGQVLGLELREVPPSSRWARVHKLLAALCIWIYRFVPALGEALRKGVESIERNKTRSRRIRARRGVVLAAGGYIFNRAMVERFAPAYQDGLPLGTPGDDGSGIHLGESAGGVTDHMERVSAWRFINPPLAWARGIIVNASGERYCDETVYGALLGERMCEGQNGRAILIIDRTLYREALREILPWKVMPFQLMAAASNLFLNATKARTLEALATACRLPSEKLIATVGAYNSAAALGRPDPLGKPTAYVHPILRPPYYAMDVSIDSKRYPCPTISFGGLVVDEETGAVLDADGAPIPGLYAAGRTAVGVASRSYVSGLSIADCVFSGRRAGRSAARRGGPEDGRDASTRGG